MKCTNCGRELSGANFCALCGTAAPAPEAPAPTFEAPMPPPIPPKYVTEATIPPAYRPLGAWAYYGLQLLFSIPIVGFILLIVFSFDDSNLNRRNFARSYWCALLVGLAVAIIGAILFAVTGAGEAIASEVLYH